MAEKLSSDLEHRWEDINCIIEQDFSAGLGEQFPPNQETLVADHPRSVSPSRVMESNTRIKHQGKYRELESHSLPELEYPGCIEKGEPLVMFGDLQVPVDVFQMSLPQGELGGTRLEDKPECFELELRQEKEVIDIVPGVGKKEPLHTTAPPPAQKRKKDKDMEAMHVLYPGEENQDYFFDTKKPYDFADQGDSSKGFTDNDWQPPVQHAQNFQIGMSSADKSSYEKFSAHFVGKDMQPIYNESEQQETQSINVPVPNTSSQELELRLVSQDLPENIFSNQPSSQFIPGVPSMDEELLSSDLHLLQEACMAINAETQQEALNFSIPRDKDREAMQVLSPGGEDHDYFLDTKKLYHFADQGNASKAFTDNDWQPPVQHAESFQKETNSAAKCIYEELSSHFVGEDMQSIYNESEWQETLSINVRDPNISPQELGIHIVGQDLPENIFINQPSSQFTPGKVSYTNEECLTEFLSQLQPSSQTQGCVLKEELSVLEGQYSEGKHLIHVTSLNHGAFGEVDRFRDFDSSHEFIRKKIALDKFRPSEVLFPLSIKHTNIMKICGLIQRGEPVRGNVMEILMENAGISLVEFVKNLPASETLSQTLIWGLTKQALEGLSMLHRERIIHLDIKPENVCVREDNGGSYTLTITDFGSAMQANQKMDFVGWTPEYMAPESCRCYLQMFPGMNTQITCKVDVFALGLTVIFLHQKKHVLLNLVTEGRNSYNGFPMEKKGKLKLQLLKYHAIRPDLARRLIPDDIEINLRELLHYCLVGDPEGRFSSQRALQFIKDVEVKQKSMSCLDQVLKESQKTQKGRVVTHPTENTQDAGEMRAICGGVKDLTKEKLRMKLMKSKKEQEVADVHTSTKTVRQNPIANPVQPPITILSRKMGNYIKSSNIAVTIQPLERKAGAINQLTKAPHALYVQNGAGPNTGSQNFFPQCIIQWTDMPQGGKPAKRRHKAELHLPGPSGKKMRQYKSGDSTIVGPAPAIPILVRADLSKSNIMDDTKPTIVDDTQPLWENTTRSIGKDSALQDPAGNMPDFSKI